MSYNNAPLNGLDCGTAIKMLRGDTFSRSLRVTERGELVTLRGSDSGTLGLFDIGGECVVKKEVVRVLPEADATCMVNLAPEDTEGLPCGRYTLEVELRFANGTVVTPIQCPLELLEDYITPEVRDAQP